MSRRATGSAHPLFVRVDWRDGRPGGSRGRRSARRPRPTRGRTRRACRNPGGDPQTGADAEHPPHVEQRGVEPRGSARSRSSRSPRRTSGPGTAGRGPSPPRAGRPSPGRPTRSIPTDASTPTTMASAPRRRPAWGRRRSPSPRPARVRRAERRATPPGRAPPRVVAASQRSNASAMASYGAAARAPRERCGEARPAGSRRSRVGVGRFPLRPPAYRPGGRFAAVNGAVVADLALPLETGTEPPHGQASPRRPSHRPGAEERGRHPPVHALGRPHRADLRRLRRPRDPHRRPSPRAGRGARGRRMGARHRPDRRRRRHRGPRPHGRRDRHRQRDVRQLAGPGDERQEPRVRVRDGLAAGDGPGHAACTSITKWAKTCYDTRKLGEYVTERVPSRERRPQGTGVPGRPARRPVQFLAPGRGRPGRRPGPRPSPRAIRTTWPGP